MRLANGACVAVPLVVFLLEMAQFVLVVLFVVVERSLAEGTREHRIGHVDPFVAPQNGSGLECFSASFAFVSLGISIAVGSNVFLELPDLDERLTARVTGETFLVLGVEVSRVVIQRRIRTEF